MDIHRSSIKDFILPKVKSVYLIDYYEGIRSILAGRDDFGFKNILANPRVRTQNEIVWSTEVFETRPLLLKELVGDEKDGYSYLLNQCIHSIEYLVALLEEEDGGKPLSELLSKVISYIDENSVYCGEGKIVLVDWGLIPRTQERVYSPIYRSGRFVANWDKKYLLPPASQWHSNNQNVVLSENRDLLTTEVSVETETLDIPVHDVGCSVGISNPVDVVGVSVKRDPASQIYSSTILNVQKESEGWPINDGNVTSEHLEEGLSSKDVVESFKDETSENKAGKHDKSDEYNWNTLFENVWKGLKFLFLKLYGFLILFILFLAVMYVCRDCQGPVHRINPYYNPLPDNPIILPVDKEHIGVSEDGMTQIATDRLNIFLEQRNEHTMLEWAKSFKKIYDSEDCEVVYYDKELDFLQIRIPDSEREAMKKNLPEQLSNFSFEVFEETLRESKVEITDPMVDHPHHSWYFNPIGAKDAWGITLGNQNVIVAIVDNGFDAQHPELTGKIYNSYNVLTQNGYVRPIVTDDGVCEHGTHVAATAAGNCNNGCGLLGIAPHCSLMLVQVGNDDAEGLMSSTAVREGILYAINQGADVVNVSIGSTVSDEVKNMSEGEQLNYITSSCRQEELLWNKVYAKAKRKNCTIVFAAGNSNVVAGVDPMKRSRDIIKVSALNRETKKASFSNYGVYPKLNREYSTLSAPGVYIYSAAPNNQYAILQGTSMAAPIVTGAVALLKSVDKNLTNEQIVSVLKKTGKNVDTNIGPMINIGKALHTLKGDTVVENKCDAIKQKVETLRAQIDSLVRICPEAAEPADTLRYSDAVKDKYGLDGVWKSTTPLVSTVDQTPVELYMTFRQMKGTLTLVNKGGNYTAPLTAKIKKNRLVIEQKGPARNGNDSFLPYVYVCSADRKGYFQCTASGSKHNKFVFNLIRIK